MWVKYFLGDKGNVRNEEKYMTYKSLQFKFFTYKKVEKINNSWVNFLLKPEVNLNEVT